jgi:hypothetical protein
MTEPFKIKLNDPAAEKTTDEIDFDAIEGIENVSPDLASVLDLESSESLDLQPEAIAKADEALTQFEQIKGEFRGHIQAATLEAMFPAVSEREDYLKRSAYRLFVDIHKAAKLFLKDWCLVNGFNQKWSNPFSAYFDLKRLTSMSQFVPKVFNLELVQVDTKEVRVLANNCLTSREACIEGAKTLGFDSSLYRLKVFARFDLLTIEELKSNPKWLAEQRMLHIFDEQLNQVATFRRVPTDVKERWKREIEEKKKSQIPTRFV